MFLTASNLVHYVRDRAYMSPTKIVSGDFIVLEAGRRNRNFKVLHRDGSGVFIKQVKVADSIENTTLRREAECYRLAQRNPEWASLMPTFLGHDERRQCLILELLPHGVNLTEYVQRGGELSRELATKLGRAIACFHRVRVDPESHGLSEISFPKRVPWILFFHRDNNRVSQAVIELGDLIRHNEVVSANLDRLCENWRFDDVIHGDMKWDNCVLYQIQDRDEQLNIVDWELFDFGDAAWDLGGFLHSFWVSAITSTLTKVMSEDTPVLERISPELAKLALPIQSLLQGYWSGRDFDRAHIASFLIRTLEYSAARLLQSAFERLYYATTMNEETRMMFGLSECIFLNPTTMITLLDLPKEGTTCE